MTTVTSIINILKDLVPESCSSIVSFSSVYKEPFVCNFLGLSVGVELPPHVVASELHVLLDILPPLRRHYSKLNEESTTTPDADLLRHYKLMVYSAAQRLPEQKCNYNMYGRFELNLVSCTVRCCRSSVPAEISSTALWRHVRQPDR